MFNFKFKNSHIRPLLIAAENGCGKTTALADVLNGHMQRSADTGALVVGFDFEGGLRPRTSTNNVLIHDTITKVDDLQRTIEKLVDESEAKSFVFGFDDIQLIMDADGLSLQDKIHNFFKCIDSIDTRGRTMILAITVALRRPLF